MTPPIYFNVKEAREFLLATGFVYTLRKPRSVGKTVAVQGSYYDHTKLCDVRVFLIKEQPSVVNLYLYVDRSGFDSIAAWLTAAKIDDPAALAGFNLYRVKRVDELPHCPILPNYTVRKDGTCEHFNACAATGKYPCLSVPVFRPDLTKHPLCTAQSQAGVSLARQEEYKMDEKKAKKSKVVLGKVALDLPTSKSVKREEKAPSPADVAIAKVEAEIAAKPTVEDMTQKEVAVTKTAKTAKVVISDAELLDLTAENFVVVMGKLGGKGVSTAQMLSYFKIRNEPKPANRWPKLRAMAKKLSMETPPKINIVFLKDKNEYRYDLP